MTRVIAHLAKVWVYLTGGEARALAAQLAAHFQEEDGPGEWRGHVESDDGRAEELTVDLDARLIRVNLVGGTVVTRRCGHLVQQL
jgi:hypothetical protein